MRPMTRQPRRLRVCGGAFAYAKAGAGRVETRWGSALDAMLAHRRVSPRALCDCCAAGRHGEVFHSPGSVPGGVEASCREASYLPAVRALRCSPAGFRVLCRLHGWSNRRAGSRAPPRTSRSRFRVAGCVTDSTYTLNRDPRARLARLAGEPPVRGMCGLSLGFGSVG